jgi:hypothetical protein
LVTVEVLKELVEVLDELPISSSDFEFLIDLMGREKSESVFGDLAKSEWVLDFDQ